MPVLKNAKHEAFAQGLAKGKTADEAYVEAGYSYNRGNAARLKANESIRKRTEEIQSRVAQKAEWSAAERIAMLQRIADANEHDDPRVTVSAIAETNKMTGAYAPVKQEIDLRTSYTDLSDAELADTIQKLMQRAGAK